MVHILWIKMCKEVCACVRESTMITQTTIVKYKKINVFFKDRHCIQTNVGLKKRQIGNKETKWHDCEWQRAYNKSQGKTLSRLFLLHYFFLGSLQSQQCKMVSWHIDRPDLNPFQRHLWDSCKGVYLCSQGPIFPVRDPQFIFMLTHICFVRTAGNVNSRHQV